MVGDDAGDDRAIGAGGKSPVPKEFAKDRSGLIDGASGVGLHTEGVNQVVVFVDANDDVGVSNVNR